MNAVQHGLAAKTLVLGTESQAGFDELHDACVEHFQPRTRFESYLVTEIAAAKWRHGRLWSIETAAIDLEIQRQQKQVDRQFAEIDDATRTALGFFGAEERSKSISLCLRYESRMLSAFHRALHALAATAEAAPAREEAGGPNEPNPISGT